MDKSALRRELMARRATAFAHASDADVGLVANFPFDIDHGAIVVGYMPFRNEIDPFALLRALAERGASIAMPRIVSPSLVWGGVGVGESHVAQSLHSTLSPRSGGGLCFHLCDLDDPSHFMPNNWGIAEPLPDLPVAAPTILLVPLLGFDRHRNRLGYGKGFYDRAIKALKAHGPLTTIGLAFSAQEVPEIPVEDHDQRLDWIVSENRAYGPI